MRQFKNEALKKEEVEKIIEAGIAAPTAHNYNPEQIYVIQSQSALEKLKQCTPCSYGTQTAFLVAYDKTKSWKRDFDGADSGEIDASIVATHMMLEATELGIGSTWVMWFDPQKVKEQFDLPDEIVPVVILVAGYPAPEATPTANHTTRRDKCEIVSML